MNSEHVTLWLGNSVSIAAIVGAFLGWAPALAAIVAAMWYLVQIYESATVQRWMANRRAHKIAALKARLIWLEAKTSQPNLEDTFGNPPAKR